MLAVVREMLDYPDEYTPNPEAMRELLLRLHGLLEHEVARRPPNRPKDNTGATAQRLFEINGNLLKARRLTAKMEGRTLGAVTRAHQRYLKQQRDKTTT